ncbi:MAG TPA: serine/threonine-protein kinase [Gemmatimonadales bacterium]|nr:serine/threonine-protein kinase [Gemmatimonadales bacterium]
MKVCPVCSTEYADEIKFCPGDGQTLRSVTPAADLVGQVVADRYHVMKQLGEGGMGRVYLAEHVKMGRRSAIKVMNPSMVHDPDAVARFNREASNASRINHPNVCAIYDFGETADGLVFLAMEFIEGEPLTDLLIRERILPVARAANIFLQTAEALQAAHELGIVHRDLKPENIMLTKGRDGSDTVKVVDFGIAKAIGGTEASQKVTKTGLVMGTPEFMSPEQLSGDNVDGRSDLYSLALVLYQMLSGKLPFEATTVQETMIKRLTEEPAKLTDVRPDLVFPPGLQAVLDSALTRTPAQRYQSVAKFAADVAAVTGRPGRPGRPVARSVPPTEAKTQLIDPAHALPTVPLRAPRKRALLPVALTVGLILVSGGVWMVLSGGNKARDVSSVPPADTPGHLTRDTMKPGVTPPNRPQAQTGIDPSKAGEILDGLIESSPTVIIDSATKVYFTAGVKDTDKAFAACLVAQAEKALGNRSTAVRWANLGLAINAQLSSCQNVVQGSGS